MRARIILARDFTDRKVIGAILFERTLGEAIDGRKVPNYLWQVRGIVPFLKIDKGLADKADGVQMMKPMPGLSDMLERAAAQGVFGTKERSVIHDANPKGIAAVVAQQFDVARAVIAAGLVPIVEPEVDIHSTTKAPAETLMKVEIVKHLNRLEADQQVILKLTLPDEAGLYADLIAHPKVLRVVALSGGYSTADACAKLAQNDGMIASFSRALTEGLNRQMSDAEFDDALGANIDRIWRASV
jgi:fructose-bisphosphate aldolase class I